MTTQLTAQQRLDEAARKITRYVDALVALYTGDYTTTVYNGYEDLPSLAKIVYDANNRVASAAGNVMYFDNRAAALAALPTLPELQIVEVLADENYSGFPRTRYRVESGALVFKINLDQVRIDLATGGIGYGADIVANAPRIVGTINSLRILPVPTAVTGRNYSVLVQEYFSGFGRGGGMFQWNPSSTAADDGWLVIRPSSAPTSGRWLRRLTRAHHCFAPEAGIFPTFSATAPDGETYSVKMQRVMDTLSALVAGNSTGGIIQLEAEHNGYVMNWTQRNGVYVEGNVDQSLTRWGTNSGVVVILPSTASVIVDWPDSASSSTVYGGGIRGLYLAGPGGSRPSIGVRVRNARRPTVERCMIEQTADEGFICETDVRLPIFKQLLVQNALLNRTRANPSYAFDVRGGGDGIIEDIEAGPSLGARSASGNVRAVRIAGDNYRFDKIIGEFGDVGIVINGLLHKFGTSIRAEFSFGPGFIIDCGTSFLGVLQSNVNSFGLNGQYPGVMVTSTASNNVAIAIQNVNDGRGNTNYGLYDLSASSTLKNQFGQFNTVSDTIAPVYTVAYGSGFLQSSGGAIQLDVNSATPNVTPGHREYVASNTVATTITSFTNFASGMEIIIGATNALTTIQNNSVMQMPGGVNLTLQPDRAYHFVGINGAIRLA